ncbi:PTS sugar transporter subunit IIA [Companilactobacillus kimchiensis]|uniref:PTS EIIA type-4 domain-containing protein n=1 Tax=Companilactobacillus kimchiensis TaxID=993692 RepID=A0A0R2LGE0_9LACO|nr:hypothetical protein [Companilactobacillus kimchiensis]KRO00873.1 hypothetical protein IV57_GL000194 [Companilactobacillus kimchiensis]
MKLLLVSHLGLASGMIKAAQFIAGKQGNENHIELDERGIESFKKRFNEVIETFDKNEQIVLVSDIPAGSPGNTALEALMKSDFKFEYLSGMNLGMILDILLSGNAAGAKDAAIASIQISNDQTADDEDSDEEF